MHSVLTNFRKGKYTSKPFPYIVIDDALPFDYYEKLDKSFPEYQKIINNQEYFQNHAYRKNAAESLSDNLIPEIWKTFIRYHTSFNFVKEVYKVFGKDIIANYPPMKNNYLQKYHCGIRFLEKKDFNVLHGSNLPVAEKISRRKGNGGVHVCAVWHAGGGPRSSLMQRRGG